MSRGHSMKVPRLGISVDEMASAEGLQTCTYGCERGALNVPGPCASVPVTGQPFGAAQPEPGRLK